MKKLILFLCLLSTTVGLVGCSSSSDEIPSYDLNEETSTRFKNVSILETARKGTETINGQLYKDGGIEISIDAFSSNAMIYVVVVPNGSSVPTNNQIKSGSDYSSVKVFGSYEAQGSLYKFIDDSEFTQGQSFDCYAVIQNDGNYSSITYSTTVYSYEQKDLIDRGAGTITDPYLISTIEELEAVGYVTSARSNAESAYYTLENNIDLSTKYNQTAYDAYAAENGGEYRDGYGSWLPLGQQTGSRRKFSGVFEGNGYTISNLFQRTEIEGSGLFSELDATGVIQNLFITNVDIHTTTQRTAAVCGYSKGTITNVAVIGGSITSTANRLGGITGQMFEAGHVVACYVDTTISTTGGDVGGIVGATTAGNLALTISYSQFTGSITGGADVGGIAGEVAGTNVIFNIVSNARITGVSGTAGAIGKYSSGTTSTADSVVMSNCFVVNTTISTNENVGYVTRNFASILSASHLYYANVSLTGTGSVNSGATNTEKTSSELLSYNFLTETLYFDTNLYVITANQVPLLKFVSDYKGGN